MKILRTATALAVLLALSVAASAGAAAKKPARPTLKLGINLVVNPGFEESTVDAATTNKIPVLPIGWTVEGATVLFDYNERGGHSGKRSAAISGSLAPGKQICDASSGAYKCAPNPAAAATGPVNDSAMNRFSIRPFWVSEKALVVKPGQAYRFSMWSIRPSLDPNAGVLGEGTASKVRWLDASGATLNVMEGPSAVKTAKREIGFRQSTLDVVAPAGAVGAKLLLGHTDYTVTSAQVAFDDISFQEILHL